MSAEQSRLMPSKQEREFATDSVGLEIYSAHYRLDRAKNWMLGGSWGLIFLLAGTVTVLAHRPVVYRYIGIDPSGKAQVIGYSDLKLTLTEAMARTYLANWATYKFATLKNTFVQEYPKHYLFETEERAVHEMQEDLKSRLIARVANGQVEQNEVVVNTPEILSFETQETKDGMIARGEALIRVKKIFAFGQSQNPRTELWDVPVEYVINPMQVKDKIKKDPLYERYNTLGVTILGHHEALADVVKEEK